MWRVHCVRLPFFQYMLLRVEYLFESHFSHCHWLQCHWPIAGHLLFAPARSVSDGSSHHSRPVLHYSAEQLCLVVGYIQEKLFALFFGDAYHPSLIVTKKDENLHMPRRAPAWRLREKLVFGKILI